MIIYSPGWQIIRTYVLRFWCYFINHRPLFCWDGTVFPYVAPINTPANNCTLEMFAFCMLVMKYLTYNNAKWGLEKRRTSFSAMPKTFVGSKCYIQVNMIYFSISLFCCSTSPSTFHRLCLRFWASKPISVQPE